MAEWLGRTGILTWAGTAIGQCKVIGYNTARPKIVTTVKGDKREKSRPGLLVSDLTFSGNLDYVVAQKTVIDLLDTATPNEALATMVFTVDTGKTWTWTTGAYPLSYSLGSPEGDGTVSLEITFAIVVEATIAWA